MVTRDKPLDLPMNRSANLPLPLNRICVEEKEEDEESPTSPLYSL